jgi:hypothetical protein
MPERTLIRVLLPHPFSPARLWISPEWIDKLTSVSARTPPKRLLMPRNSMKSDALWEEASVPASCR